ncbi:MAG TPA: ornithine aminotransferase [Acetobacteraceae bacterium]|nr:ornithine aminotransferase [Acetobacteraceae bacterium]
MPDDITLQAMVMDELAWEPSVDAAHIGVSVKNGVVTLSGFVDNYAAKAAAEQAVGRVRGVKAIAEEIEVRLPHHQQRADDEIAERAVRILGWDIEVPAGRIHITVAHGEVTLTGEVDHYFQRHAAENAVRRLSGVRSVINLLTVSHRAGAAPQSRMIRQKIEEALRRSANIDASGIEIGVDGGTITLKGHVRSWSERGAVRHAAWAAPGVHEVRDQLAIQS